MGDRNRVGIGLSYRPAGIHRLAELIPWNLFLGLKTWALCADHQTEDRQQPLCQGIPGLGPPHRPGEGDHGGHDGVQDAQVARQSQLKLANHSIKH